MGITLFDEAVLSEIPEVEDEPTFTKDEASLESFAVSTATEIKDNQIVNSAPAKPATPTPPPLVQYTITPLNSGTGKMVTFYLNVQDLNELIINQFILLSDILVKPEDVLFVHLPSVLEAPVSPVLYNTIKACKAKAKIGCNPYVLNSAAFYPLLSCDFIMPCKYGIARFDAMSLIAGGAGHLDAENALRFDKDRKFRLLKEAENNGFIPGEQMNHILEDQGSYSIYGEEFYQAIIAYNRNHRPVRPATVNPSSVRPPEQVISEQREIES